MSFTIDQAKELIASYLPILFYDFVFTNGDTLSLSRLDMTFTSGTGNTYLGRIENDDLDTVQMLDVSGVDIPPRLSITVADSDAYVYQYYETYAGRGFRGAIVTVTLAFYDTLGQQFSTDSFVRYVGICDSAVPVDDTRLSIKTTYKMLLQQKMLPSALIQQYCWKIQPQSVAQCALAQIDHNDFWWCGLATVKPPCGQTRTGCQNAGNFPFFSGVDFQPNQDGGTGKDYISGQNVQLFNSGSNMIYGNPWPMVLGTAWVTCPVLNMTQDGNYTYLDVGLCVDYIDAGYDSVMNMQVICAGERIPPAFYIDPTAGIVNLNPGNVAWWGWVTQGYRDGNTAGRLPGNYEEPYGSEVVIQVVVPHSIASGQAPPSVQVLFSGPQVRVYTTTSAYTYQFSNNPAWVLMYLLTLSGWDYSDLDIEAFINAANDCAEMITYNDQYGGFGLTGGVESVSVTNEGSGYDAPPAPGPTVQFTGGGGSGATAIAKVTPNNGSGSGGHVYQVQVTSPGQNYTSAPSVSIFDSDGHGSGATATASIGSTAKHQRYACNLALPARRQAGDIIQGIRRTACALLRPNSAGLIGMQVKGPLAAEQPVAPDGTNYTTAVASVMRDGSTANGYVAYSFDETNAISVQGVEVPITDSPNSLTVNFQDSENIYAPTTATIVDSDDISRVGQQVTKTVVYDGCASSDQANRLCYIQNKETLRGNPEGDTRGTLWFQITTSIRAIKIQIGNIVMLSWMRLGISNQLFRVMTVKGPAHDGTIKLMVAWHNDAWYVDNANQNANPNLYSNPKRKGLDRASYPLCPCITFPRSGDPYYAVSDGTFSMVPNWGPGPGPNGQWNGQIQLGTRVPINNAGIAQPPQIALQANVSTSGGGLADGLYYVAVCAKDSSGNYSYGSVFSVSFLTGGGGSGLITVPIIWWDQTNTVGYAVFAGDSPFRLSWQGDGTNNSDGTGKPTSITLTRYLACEWGLPDQELDAIVPQVKYISHSGIAGVQVQSVATGQINVGYSGWGASTLAGRECSLLAKYDGSAPAVLNYSITANTDGGLLTVTPDPVADGIVEGDLIVIRSKPTITNSGMTWTDAMWQNPTNSGSGLAASTEVGKVGRIIAGTGRGLENLVVSATSTSHTFGNQWLVTPDSTSRMIICDSNWQPLAAPMRGINNSSSTAQINPTFPVDNYATQTLLIGMQTEDGGEDPGYDALMPVRELYVFGKPENLSEVTA